MFNQTQKKMETSTQIKLRIATMADFICKDAAGNDIICKKKDYWITQNGSLTQMQTSSDTKPCDLVILLVNQKILIPQL